MQEGSREGGVRRVSESRKLAVDDQKCHLGGLWGRGWGVGVKFYVSETEVAAPSVSQSALWNLWTLLHIKKKRR